MEGSSSPSTNSTKSTNSIDSQSNFVEKYFKVKMIGQGSYGVVYLVKGQRSGELCVMKQLDLTHLQKDEQQKCLQEAKILKVLNNQFIVGYKDVYKTTSGKLCIIMEYCENGDFDKEVKRRQALFTAQNNKDDDMCNVFFDDDDVLKWFAQLCLAMKQVHDYQIIHRDIKTANIFWDQDLNLKLADFGIARVLSSSQSKAGTSIGSPFFMAPEIFENQKYGMEVDIWSMGVFLYYLHTLSLPFSGNSEAKLIKQILSCKYDKTKIRNNNLKEIIGHCLKRHSDQNPRKTIRKLIKHPAIAKKIHQMQELTQPAKILSLTTQQQQISNDLTSSDNEDLAETQLPNKESTKNTQIGQTLDPKYFIKGATELQFKEFMSKEFGDESFDIAFKSILENRELIYSTEDGNNADKQLIQIIQNLQDQKGDGNIFSNVNSVSKFIEYASLYIMSTTWPNENLNSHNA